MPTTSTQGTFVQDIPPKPQPAPAKAPAKAIPPDRIYIFELKDLLFWYEQTLGAKPLKDPRGDLVRFESERFPYLIKLNRPDGKPLSKPAKEVEKIRKGEKTRKDYGPPDPDRASTLSWISDVVENPHMIVKNYHPFVPGDEIYIKEYDKKDARFKEVVCLRFRTFLVPVSSFLVWKPKYKNPEDILWPQRK